MKRKLSEIVSECMEVSDSLTKQLKRLSKELRKYEKRVEGEGITKEEALAVLPNFIPRGLIENYYKNKEVNHNRKSNKC